MSQQIAQTIRLNDVESDGDCLQQMNLPNSDVVDDRVEYQTARKVEFKV